MNRTGLIPLSALVVAGTVTFADIQSSGKMPSTRQWLGLAVTYTGISLASDLGFAAAPGFAVLLMISAFVTRGYEAIEYLTGKAGPKKHPKAKKVIRPPARKPQQFTEPSTPGESV